MRQKGYRIQFLRKVGFNLYPGTLNLKLQPSEVIKRRELEGYPPILIKGFITGDREFGDVRCHRVVINNEVEGAVIMINRTHHDYSVLEVVALINLRNGIGLKDGSKVVLSFSHI